MKGFQGAVEKACYVFGVDKFFPEQKKALKAFVSRKDILQTCQRDLESQWCFTWLPKLTRNSRISLIVDVL